jgi:hypothetical protein
MNILIRIKKIIQNFAAAVYKENKNIMTDQ